MKYTSVSVQKTEEAGSLLAKKITSPSFIALYGDLGAGKTAFVRGFVKELIGNVIVTSPTYNVFNHYTGNDLDIYHFDMYRITDDDDLYSVGFYDILDHGIIISEWSENISYAIPDDCIRVYIKKDNEDENIRYIEITEGNKC